MRSLFRSETGALLSEEGEGEGCASASAGTVDSARSRLSTVSSKSLAKREMENSRAELTSRFVRSCRLRKSATERRYLSWSGKKAN